MVNFNKAVPINIKKRQVNWYGGKKFEGCQFLNNTTEEHKSKLFQYEGKIKYMATIESLYHVFFCEMESGRKYKKGETNEIAQTGMGRDRNL